MLANIYTWLTEGFDSANLIDANLARANVTDVFYDAATVWPKGFTPPPSRSAL